MGWLSRALGFLSVLLMVGCAQPLRTATRLSVACSMTAHFVDISTTMFAVGRGLGKELNPVLAPHIENAAAVGAFKGAVAVGANYPLLVLHESSPKLTLALGIGQCVGFSLIGAHNARVIRDAR